MSAKAKIEAMNDGPLIASGSLLLEDERGERTAAGKKTALCRCGASGNKPFCDGSHREAGFGSALESAEPSAPPKEGDALVRILEDGPYEVCGDAALCCEDGSGLSSDDPYYLCRCGASENKPFCDGSHRRVGFVGGQS